MHPFYFIKRPFSEGAQIWLKLKNELNKVELKMAFGGGLLSNFLLYLPPFRSYLVKTTRNCNFFPLRDRGFSFKFPLFWKSEKIDLGPFYLVTFCSKVTRKKVEKSTQIDMLSSRFSNFVSIGLRGLIIRYF